MVGIRWYCAEISPNRAALLPFMTIDLMLMHLYTWSKASRETWLASSPTPRTRWAQAPACSKGWELRKSVGENKDPNYFKWGSHPEMRCRFRH